jgi:hypothetical protein
MLYDSNGFKPYICFDFHNLSMYHTHTHTHTFYWPYAKIRWILSFPTVSEVSRTLSNTSQTNNMIKHMLTFVYKKIESWFRAIYLPLLSMVAMHPMIDHKTSQCRHRRWWPVKVTKPWQPWRLGQSQANRDGTATMEVVPRMMVGEGAPDMEEMEVKRWGWSWAAVP